MQLSVDMGNSLVKLGVFDGDELLATEVHQTLTVPVLSQVLYNHSVDFVILCSVRKPDAELEAYLEEHVRWVRLQADTPLPIRVQYKTPETLGQDRVAAVAGARALFPNQNCLVVDAGTCITYELLRADGTYLGGNIAPGMDMRLRAMHEFTARLPLVNRGEPDFWIGNDTPTAIRNGAQWGTLLEVEGMLNRCEAYFSEFQPVFTGGDADFLAKNVKSKIFVHPHLVLLGLNSILRHYAN
jgi:type III pantothenate kinase